MRSPSQPHSRMAPQLQGRPLRPRPLALTATLRTLTLSVVANAAAKLGQVEAQRRAAANRIEELERERVAAVEAIREAAAALANHERADGAASERTRVEGLLAQAREKAQDPALAARLDGARARVRDL